MTHQNENHKGQNRIGWTQPESAAMTVDEAHGVLGKKTISRGAFYAAVNRKEVPAIRLGGRILIPRHAFMLWLETGGQSQEDTAARRGLPA